MPTEFDPTLSADELLINWNLHWSSLSAPHDVLYVYIIESIIKCFILWPFACSIVSNAGEYLLVYYGNSILPVVVSFYKVKDRKLS